MTDTEVLAALLSGEITGAGGAYGRNFLTIVAARLIAAGVTLTPADAPSDLRAFIATIHPDGVPCVCVQAILDFLDGTAPVADVVHWDSNARAALSGDRPSPEADPTPCICGKENAEDCVANYPTPGDFRRGHWPASPATAPAEGLDAEHVLALAKKAAEYGRGGKWNDSLGVALARIDAEYARLAPDSAQENPARDLPCGCVMDNHQLLISCPEHSDSAQEADRG